MAATRWMDTISNNLANASTNGFKADEVSFSDVFVKEVYENGGSGSYLGSVGTGPVEVGEFTRFTLGPTHQTSNPLDLSLGSVQTMFSVQNSVGEKRYTRDGSFQMDENRNLVTRSGLKVLDDQGKAVQLGAKGEIKIAGDGTVMQGGQRVAKLAVYTGTFAKEGVNLCTASNVSQSAAPMIQQGFLEGSNADPVSSMIELIQVNRLFEMAQKSIQSQDEMTGKLIETTAK